MGKMGKTSKTGKTNTTSRTKMKPDLVIVLRSYGPFGPKKDNRDAETQRRRDNRER